ncbi:hypothetical protein [Methanobacterium sp. ACI-7]|uniref:hypothetical protein n=1 Tax=unclassified Methanobacterium TaxID=2627676 RepID=UPI0039C0C0C8
MTPIKFPNNPFPDVKATEFHKLNKEVVSEDFVEGNFKDLNWKVYKPLMDKGIDRIITKNICPEGHTPLNENLRDECNKCGKKPIRITRYIQIKTREVKGKKSKNQLDFGYTLSPRDFIPDPRHIFLFYSDHTEDFIIISILEYLKTLVNLKYTTLSAPSFKQGNYRIYPLKYKIKEDKWIFKVKNSEESWERFRNLEGVKKIQNPKIDNNLNLLSNITTTLKNRLFRNINEGNLLKDYENSLTKIHEYLNYEKSIINVKEMRNDTINELSTSLTPQIRNSINKSYWFRYRGLDMHE